MRGMSAMEWLVRFKQRFLLLVVIPRFGILFFLCLFGCARSFLCCFCSCCCLVVVIVVGFCLFVCVFFFGGGCFALFYVISSVT